MVLAMMELEHGDGEWENIQSVLRSAFLVHEQRLRTHDTQLEGQDQQIREGIEQWTITSKQLNAVQGHVEKLARVVQTLSEELHQRAQADQVREQRQTQWMVSVKKELEGLQSRVLGDMETVYTKALTTMQRRIELMEEELGHLAAALDRKADQEVVKVHHQAMEEALKQRCRKAAFDREVVRVHQLLRTQHAQIYQRMEALHGEVHSQTDAQQRRALMEAEVQSKQCQEKLHQIREDILAAMTEKLQTVEEVAERRAKTLETAIQDAQRAAMHHATELVAKQTEEMSKMQMEWDPRERIAALERKWNEWRQEAALVKANLMEKITILQKELEQSIATMTEGFNQHKKDHTTASEDLETHKKEVTVMRDDLDKRLTETLDTQQRHELHINQLLEAGITQVERTNQLQRDVEQQLTVQNDVRVWIQARDKKTRQQMHSVADKLREMDQILKLVGNQLVHNTSQLQVMWIDQHDTIPDDRDDLKLLETEANPSGAECVPLEEVEPIDDLQRSRHQQLHDSIEAKLRDYHAVLSTNDTCTLASSKSAS